MGLGLGLGLGLRLGLGLGLGLGPRALAVEQLVAEQPRAEPHACELTDLTHDEAALLLVDLEAQLGRHVGALVLVGLDRVERQAAWLGLGLGFRVRIRVRVRVSPKP